MIPTRKSLLSRLKRWDDQASWQDFYDTYSALVFGAAVKAGLNHAEAEDVVQETILAVAGKIKDFKYEPERCAFKTWLYAITRRQVANQFRKRGGKGRLLEPLSSGNDTTTPEDIPDPASQALDEAWERDWELNLIRAATERVKRRAHPEHFQIFEYHVLQDHSVMETARVLCINAAKVYVVKHRLTAQVKREISYLRTKYV